MKLLAPICKNKILAKLLVVIFLYATIPITYGQTDSVKQNQLRKTIFIESGLYVSSMLIIGPAWYSGFDHTSWHWFDDSGEWMQMDKIGHAFATYQSARLAYELHCKTGFTKKQSMFYSTLASFMAISSIEIFDGFAKEWGASLSDVGANAVGVALFALQQGVFDKQIAKLKFSYHPTNFYTLRPELLGKNHAERLIKDYNAQQYWLSVNLYDLFKLEFLPKFINISFGYGATNMISANHNNSINQGFTPYRRFFISPDIDLEKIKTRSKILRFSLKALNAIKIPMPTIELNKQETKYMWLY